MSVIEELKDSVMSVNKRYPNWSFASPRAVFQLRDDCQLANLHTHQCPRFSAISLPKPIQIPFLALQAQFSWP